MKEEIKQYLKRDNEVKYLTSPQELKEYLDFRKAHDEWIEPFINELGAVGVPSEPLFIQDYCKDIEISKHGYKQSVGDIDLDDKMNQECVDDTGLFLVAPYRNKVSILPTRTLAYATICKRADDACGTMYRFDERPNKGVLPINEKADRLTRDYQLYSDKCKILFRDGKVSAVLSKEYQILPCDELVGALESQLKKDHPSYIFDGSQVSHEYLMVEYLLNDEEMEETTRLRLNDAGASIDSLKVGVRFASSDVGLSKVYAYMFYDIDGARTTLSGAIQMTHKGDASVDVFKARLEELGNSFKESEAKIEALGNIDIMNVPLCVQKIADANPSVFPKGSTEEVVNDLNLVHKTNSTAIDVYLALNNIVQRHCMSGQINPTRYLNLTELVSRCMNLDFAAIDKGQNSGKIGG